MFTRQIKRHDTRVTPWVRLLDEAGVPIPLIDCTVVYTLQNLADLTNTIERAPAIIRDQLLYPGEVFFQFLPAHTDEELHASEEWEVEGMDGLKESFPVGEQVFVSIEADLDNT